VVERLFKAVEMTPGYQLRVDLSAQTVTTPAGESFGFDIDPFRKECLMNGLDDIGLTLQYTDDIWAYEARRRQQAPWLFTGLESAP
jgi:3-isopropylmalate/(R)-2-methylmalate dehydratase small subunit